jgi:hypothetical protein
MPKMRIFVLLFLIFCLTSFQVTAQIFSDVTSSYGIAALNASTFYGAGSSCFDVNEDGWDDLTVCIAGGATRLYMNNQGVFQLHTAFDNIYDAKTCLWGDYDEDGDNDLFVIKRDGPSQLFVQTDSLVFSNQSALLGFPYNPTYNSFGAALGDYNRDSYLDLYVANYSTATVGGIKSKFFTNSQNGSFTSNLHGHNRNHFQPAFIDLYRDLFQDIFVIVDFRVGSEYFLQDTNGVFTDYTLNGVFGLGGPIDAMTNSWCDYDNDSDLDIYIANTPTNGNFLMENDGTNNFSNVAPSVGAALYKWSWSSLWLDLENDGWNDLIVDERHVNPFYLNEFGNHVLRNNQGTFTEDLTSGISNLPYGYFTSSKGDFNNDGLYDLYLGAETGQQSRVFQNNSETSNNYMKCRLKGRLSNHNGVGTHIDYYLNGEHRVHYTQLGENYLCQNSQNYIFGLGENTQIDSLKLSWISGVEDTYYNIPANSTHVFVEGETKPQIQASKSFLCPNANDSLQLSISGWPNHTWDNGSTAESIWVTSPGVYSVAVGTGYGHTLQLNYEVQMAQLESYEIINTPVSCAGDSTGAVEVIKMNTGELVFAANNLTAGDYLFPIMLYEGCVVEENIHIDEPLPFTLLTDSLRPACFGLASGSAVVRGLGGTAPYASFNSEGILHLNNLPSGNYTDAIADANGCISNYNFNITEIPSALIDITSPLNVCPNDFVIFEATVSDVGNNYAWDVLSPGALLGAGSYHASVVDTLLCVTTVFFEIQEFLLPTITANVLSQSTLGVGSIVLDVIGNYPPYTATWQSGFEGFSYSGLAQGTYFVSVSDSLGCVVDTSFTVLFEFVEEEVNDSDFIVDWKEGVLKYSGNEMLFDIEIFNSIGQLIYTKPTLRMNEIIHLNTAPQPLYISTSKGKSRTKIVLH